MSRFSVKRPYTVIVSVLIVIILGIVSFTKLSTDLLPNMEMPYAIVMTTYQGASPEQVEQIVTEPVEASMATVSNIKHVSSTSSENYSLVVLEFNTNTNMDSAMIEMRESLDMIRSYWPEGIGSPIIMKMNPDMMPVMMAAVDGEGKTPIEVTKLFNEKISPDIESLEGVASVTATGLTEASVQVVLSEEKLLSLSEKLTKKINEKFDEAQGEIDDGKDKLDDGKEALENGKVSAADKMAEAENQLTDGKIELSQGESALADKKAQLELAEKAIETMETELLEAENNLTALGVQLETAKASAEAMNQSIQSLTIKLEEAKKAKQEVESETFKQNYEAALASKAAIEGQILEVQGNAALTEEEKTAQLNALNGQLEQVLSQISGYDTIRETAAQYDTIEENLKTVTAQKAELDAEIVKLETSYNAAKALLGDTSAAHEKIDTAKKQLEEGKSAVAAAEAQIASGKQTLDAAMHELSKNKALATIDMSVAEAQLAAGEAQLEAAQSELDKTKASALENSDIGKMITKETVEGILTAQNFSMPAGYVTEDGMSYMVRVGDKFEDIEDMENLVITDLSKQGLGVIYLKDVADIAVTDNSDEVYAKMNGNAAVLVSVEKQNGYSTADVAKRVRAYMASDTLKEYGVSMTALMDQGIYIDQVISSVLKNLVIGALLAIIVLLIFLKDIRPTFVIAISIPISVIFAMTLMYFTGISMNIISLSGLALGVGMLVDNSIVVIENIYRLRSEGKPVKEAAINGAKQVTGAIAASTLTTVCIWAPIIFTEGLTRQLFVDLVLTIAYSLIASLIVALTVVPMMAAGLLKTTQERVHPIFNKILNRYEKALRWSLSHRIAVVVITIGLLAVSVGAVMVRGMEFMGESDSDQISVSVKMDEDTTFDEAVKIADEVMVRTGNVEGVADVGVMLGSGLSMMTSMGNTATDSATMYVLLDDERSQTSQEIAAEIETATADMDCEVKASGTTMDMSALGGSGITVMVKGREIDTLKQIATDIAKEMESIEGVINVSDGQENPAPELRVSIRKEEAMLHHLTVAQVYQQLSAALSSSSSSGVLSTDEEDINIYVSEGKNQGISRNDIKAFTLTSKDAAGTEEKVLLSDIADITDDMGLSAVTRDGGVRYIRVSCGVDDAHNATLVSRAFKDTVKDYALPAGYSLEYSGENESINEAVGQLMQLLGLGILIMYLIMVAQFQSLLSPFIVMFTIPLAFTGGFIGLWLTGNRLSVIALVGFVMLCGIIVNNGIVFIDYVNQLRLEGVSKKEALVMAGRTRMRPILMTALTTILAMSTMALGIGDGSDMVQPMAIVTIGGMIYGTLLTVIVVPVIYDIFHRERLKQQ